MQLAFERRQIRLLDNVGLLLQRGVIGKQRMNCARIARLLVSIGRATLVKLRIKAGSFLHLTQGVCDAQCAESGAAVIGRAAFNFRNAGFVNPSRTAVAFRMFNFRTNAFYQVI